MKKIFIGMTMIALCITLSAQEADSISNLEARISTLEKIAKKITVSGTMQAQFVQNDSSSNTASEGFILKKARLKIVAAPTDKLSAVYQFDIANTFLTLDAYMQYAFSGSDKTGYAVRLGQFSLPFRSDIDSETPDSAVVVGQLAENLNGKVISKSQGLYFSTAQSKNYSLQMSLTSAAGRNATNTNGNKALVTTLRGKAKFGNGLTGGASLLYSKQNKGFVPNNPVDTTYFRYGIDVQYKVNNNITLQAEYIGGTDDDSDDAPTINSHGYSGLAAYTFDEKNQAVLMYDNFSTTGQEDQNTFTVGYVYKINSNLKVKAFEKFRTGATEGNDFVLDATLSF